MPSESFTVLTVDTSPPITIPAPQQALPPEPLSFKSLPTHLTRVSTYPQDKSHGGRVLPLPKPSILKFKPFYASDTHLLSTSGHSSSRTSLEDEGEDAPTDEPSLFFDVPHVEIFVGGTNVDDLVEDLDNDSGLEGTSGSSFGDLSPNSEAILIDSTTEGGTKFHGVIEVDRPPSPPLPHRPQRRNSMKSQAFFLDIEQPLRRSHSFSQKKKGVTFLDEDGIHELALVHYCEEPNDCPPTLRNANVLKLLDLFFPEDSEEYAAVSASTANVGATQSQCSTAVNASSQNVAEQIWQLNFDQPASDHSAFRARLQRCNVALENAMLRSSPSNDVTIYTPECHVIAMIKVKNVAYHKAVTVRWTKNQWISYMDEPAGWSNCDPESGTDTFTAKFRIPSDDSATHRIEFCIRYVATGAGEFWDNFDSKNYAILSRSAKLLWG